jgi:hypothetical protein
MPVPSNITGCSTDTAANIITIGADGVPTTNDHLARGYANDRTIAQIAQQAATQNPDVTFAEPPTTGKYTNSKLSELISDIFTLKNWNGAAYDTWLTISQFWRGVLSSANSNDAQAALGIQIPYRNYIDNPISPAGIVYQRTVAATADDVYFADRWYALTQTATVTPSIITAPEAGFASGLRVTQSQATAQRHGFAQILPADYVNELVSGNASCSFRVRISNTTTLRFALLGWTGTADTVISDVVNDWTSTNYSTGNFFISTSLSVIATGSQAMTANTFATLSINAAAIPANVKNLILFCWTDTTQAQNSTLDFHDARLTKTDVRAPVVTRGVQDEQKLCERFVEKSYSLNIPPGAATETGKILFSNNGAGLCFNTVFFKTAKNNAPSLIYYDLIGNQNKISSGGVHNNSIVAGGISGSTDKLIIDAAINNIGGNAKVEFHYFVSCDL